MAFLAEHAGACLPDDAPNRRHRDQEDGKDYKTSRHSQSLLL
jgi:hypothetical protein